MSQKGTLPWVIMKGITLFFCLLLPLGCAAYQHSPQHIDEVSLELEHHLTFKNGTLQPVSISLFWKMVEEADVIVLGELHDHVIGHAFQNKVVDRVMSLFPKSTLALEMLERDEQPIIDDFMEGIISGDNFAKLTHSQNWSGKDSWAAWYQPIINTTKVLGGSVVGANAPRRYVTLGRTDGFSAIEALPENRRKFVTTPDPLIDNHYQDRFFELAGITNYDEQVDEIERVLGFYRAQQIWDATMAESVVQLKPFVDAKAILLVGQFHVEYEGGLVQFLKRGLPDANILTITVHPALPEPEFEDIPISDIVVYEK